MKFSLFTALVLIGASQLYAVGPEEESKIVPVRTSQEILGGAKKMGVVNNNEIRIAIKDEKELPGLTKNYKLLAGAKYDFKIEVNIPLSWRVFGFISEINNPVFLTLPRVNQHSPNLEANIMRELMGLPLLNLDIEDYRKVSFLENGWGYDKVFLPPMENTSNDELIAALNDMGCFNPHNKFFNIDIRPDNIDTIERSLAVASENLSFYNPYVLIKCPIDARLMDLLCRFPKISGIKLDDSKQLTVPHMEWLAGLISKHSDSLLSLILCGRLSASSIFDPQKHATANNYFVQMKHGNDNQFLQPVITSENIAPLIPALSSLKALQGLIMNSLAFNNEDIERKFWEAVGRLHTLELIDMDNFLPSSLDYSTLEKGVFANLTRMEVLSMRGLHSKKILAILMPNFPGITRFCPGEMNDDELMKMLAGKKRLRELDLSAYGFAGSKGGFSGKFFETIRDALLKKLDCSNQSLQTGSLKELMWCDFLETLEHLDLSNNNGLKGGDMCSLIAALKSAKKLECLDVSGWPGITKEDFKNIERALPQTMRRLRATGHSLSHSEVFDLTELLQKTHPKMVTVFFTNKQLYNDPVASFIIFGRNDGPVVDFSSLTPDRHPGHAGLRLMGKQLIANKKINKLIVQCSKEDLLPILDAIYAAPHITTLVTKPLGSQLDWNMKQLPVIPHLKSLKGFSNHIYLLDSLISPWATNLKTLEFSHYTDGGRLSDFIWKIVADLLEYSLPNLEELNLSHNGLNSDYNAPSEKSHDPKAQFKRLVDFVTGPKSKVRKLDISHNDLDGDDLEGLLTRRPNALRELDISHNRDRDDMARLLKDFLATYHHITSLDLDGNIQIFFKLLVDKEDLYPNNLNKIDQAWGNNNLQHLGIANSSIADIPYNLFLSRLNNNPDQLDYSKLTNLSRGQIIHLYAQFIMHYSNPEDYYCEVAKKARNLKIIADMHETQKYFFNLASRKVPSLSIPVDDWWGDCKYTDIDLMVSQEDRQRALLTEILPNISSWPSKLMLTAGYESNFGDIKNLLSQAGMKELVLKFPSSLLDAFLKSGMVDVAAARGIKITVITEPPSKR